MSRNKTGLIILTILAGVFFLFIAFIFNSSTKMQAVIERKADLDERFDEIAEKDITIYWIGEPYKELEHLMPVISVVTPGSASANNLPVKGPSFHTTEYNTEGMLIEEDIPIDYPEYMFMDGHHFKSEYLDIQTRSDCIDDMQNKSGELQGLIHKVE